MKSMFFGERGPADGAAGADDNEDDGEHPRGLAERAFDFLMNPFNSMKQGANGDNGALFGGSNPNNEISRLSLQYSSANMSEEESSSLINILDRKKYNERIQATRSADDHPQPR